MYFMRVFNEVLILSENVINAWSQRKINKLIMFLGWSFSLGYITRKVAQISYKYV